MEERPTAECSWQVSRARPKGPQQTLGRTNSGSHRGETRMVQHSDDDGGMCRSAEADDSAVSITIACGNDGDRLW